MSRAGTEPSSSACVANIYVKIYIYIYYSILDETFCLWRLRGKPSIPQRADGGVWVDAQDISKALKDSCNSILYDSLYTEGIVFKNPNV